MTKEFVQRNIVPNIKKIEKERASKEFLMKLGEQGFMGTTVPQQYGGSGMDMLSYAIILEEISKVSPSVCVILDVDGLVEFSLIENGTEEQKQKYLPKLATGEFIGAYALTEPAAGSDVAGIQTRAVRDGEFYNISGTKTFITSGGIADLFLIFARTSSEAKRTDGLSAFLMERKTDNLEVGPDFEKMGLRGSYTNEITLNNVRVNRSQILGKEGDGFKIAMSSLNMGRIGIGSQALGIAETMLEKMISYSKERKAFEKQLSEMEAIQFYIAEIATKIEGAKLLVYNAAKLYDQKKDVRKEASMAKYYASSVAVEASRLAVQIYGGYGYIEDFDIERYYRDAKVTEIYEGTSEIQKLVIARELLK
jgi:alkylation response protein AidB-like acyl-CoA dehydrogenase